MSFLRMSRVCLPVIVSAALAACGGGGGGGPISYSVGGTVTGLSGTGLVLSNNGGDNLAISAGGAFTFATKLTSGAPYSVSVHTQPTGPSQICAVSNASGTVSGVNVTNVAVVCTNTFAVGGTVTGLTGSGLVLRDNGGDDLAVSADGPFSFSTAIASGTTYRVSVFTQPSSPAQNCTLTNGTARGTVQMANVTTVAVVCANVGRFAYVANEGDHTISAYAIDATTGALKQIAGSPFTGQLHASYVAAEPTGRFLYALDAVNGSGVIDVFSIDATTGGITAVAGSPFPTDAPAYSIVIHPSGKFAYTANINAMSVSAYAINTTTGALTHVAGSPFVGGYNPASITTDPSGKFVYVTNSNGSTSDVSAYLVDAMTGALTPIAGSPFKAGFVPYSISVDPSGKFAYVANDGSNDVSAFAIDATTGALAPLSGGPYATGPNPFSLAADPSGTFLFVANSNGLNVPGSNYVSAFTIDASTGALTPVPGGPFATVQLADSLAVDPSGKFVYVTNGDPPANNISAFAIDQNTGALTPVPGSPFPAGPNPQSIAVSR